MWLQYIFVVTLVERQWLLDELAVFDNLLEVDRSFTNHIVALEKVTVVGLEAELEVFSRNLNSVDESVLEIRLSVLVSEVSVSFLYFFLSIEEAAEEYVTCTFPIHDLHVDSVEHYDSHLEPLCGLL